MAEFASFCIIVFLVVVFWEFFACVGACLLLYACGYIVCSWFNPEMEINYCIAAKEYVQVEDQLEFLILSDTDNQEQKEELTKQRADKIDKMRNWIIEKKIWRKYDKTDQENGIKQAMTKRITKEEKTIRKRQAKENKQ